MGALLDAADLKPAGRSLEVLAALAPEVARRASPETHALS